MNMSANSGAHRRTPAGLEEAQTVDWHASAVSSSSYAIPIQFLWLSDVCSQSLAWLAAWQLTPVSQWLASAERLGRLHWFAVLSPPPAAAAVGLRPFGEVLWIPAAMIPVTLLFMQMLGGYLPLLTQSRTRVALT